MPPRRPPARSCGAACAAAILSKQQRMGSKFLQHPVTFCIVRDVRFELRFLPIFTDNLISNHT